MTKNLENWLGRTAYQIMPDRFCKLDESLKAIPGRSIKAWDDRMPNWRPNIDGEYTNDYFYCGNLKGIESKLEYIKDLGFDLIYLTPIESSFSYHHYDPGNHDEVDQWLGTWEDFTSMCKKAHELDMLVVVDLVFNHTGIRSVYFDNPEYSEWYKRKPNGEPVFWWDFKDLPECDTLNHNYQSAMVKVAEKYLEKGADGFRLDLGENLPKEFLTAIQTIKKKYPNAIIIGEMWGIATDRADPKIFDGQLDSVMNYPMADAILRWVRYGEAGHFRYNFERVYGEYPHDVQNLLLNNIATHDTPTTMTMLVGDKMNSNVFDKQIWDIETPWRSEKSFDTYSFREFEAKHDSIQGADYIKAKALTQIAVAILYMIPGIPCVYQGTEIADYGYKDPFNRKPYDWDKSEDEMKQFMAKMGKIRRENSNIFKNGMARIVHIDESILILERYIETGEHILLAVNRTTEWQQITLPVDGNVETLYSTVNTSRNWLNDYGIVIARQ